MLDNLSPELQFLFQAIRTVILGENVAPKYKAINENELQRKLRFHSIRLIVNDFLPYDSQVTRVKGAVKAFSQNQAFLALQHQVETQRLFKLFRAENVRVLPYKGNLFAKLIYKNQQLREFSDIDLLFHPEDAAKGLQLLWNDGYASPDLKGISQSNKTEEIFNSQVTYELPLFKDGIHLDFHWGLHYNFLPYHVPFEACFQNLAIQSGFDQEIALPSNEMMFVMMINHHGGKECWLRLKNLVDLIMFFENVAMDYSKAIALIEDSRLLTSLKNGLFISKTFFGYHLPQEMEALIKDHRPKNLKLTTEFWEKAEHWGNLKPRIHFERILLKQQDKPFNSWSYFRAVYRSYSSPTPFELERLWTFPKGWYFLNFLSKIFTYLIKKTIR